MSCSRTNKMIGLVVCERSEELSDPDENIRSRNGMSMPTDKIEKTMDSKVKRTYNKIDGL